MRNAAIFSGVFREMLSVVILEERPERSEKDYHVDHLRKEISRQRKLEVEKYVCMLLFGAGQLSCLEFFNCRGKERCTLEESVSGSCMGCSRHGIFT